MAAMATAEAGVFNKALLNLERAKRPGRPTTLGEAKRIILDRYESNQWDRSAQLRFHMICGLEPKPLEEYDKDEVRVVLDRMEMSRMVLYAEENSQEKKK